MIWVLEKKKRKTGERNKGSKERRPKALGKKMKWENEALEDIKLEEDSNKREGEGRRG